MKKKRLQENSRAESSRPKGARGVVFSIDAVFALLLGMFLLLYAFSAISKIVPEADASLQLSRQSADFLLSLEKTGALSRLSVAEVQNLTSLAPANLCLSELKAKKYPLGTAVFSASPLGDCACAERIVSTKRSFVIVNSSDSTQSNFIAELKSCLRQRG